MDAAEDPFDAECGEPAAQRGDDDQGDRSAACCGSGRSRRGAWSGRGHWAMRSRPGDGREVRGETVGFAEAVVGRYRHVRASAFAAGFLAGMSRTGPPRDHDDDRRRDAERHQQAADDQDRCHYHARDEHQNGRGGLPQALEPPVDRSRARILGPPEPCAGVQDDAQPAAEAQHQHQGADDDRIDVPPVGHRAAHTGDLTAGGAASSRQVHPHALHCGVASHRTHG